MRVVAAGEMRPILHVVRARQKSGSLAEDGLVDSDVADQCVAAHVLEQLVFDV